MIVFIYGMCEKCAIKYARVWSVRRTFFKACALLERELVLEHEPETWHVRTSVFTNYFPIIAICTNIYSIQFFWEPNTITYFFKFVFDNSSMYVCIRVWKKGKEKNSKTERFFPQKKAMISWQKWYFVS